MLHDDDSIAELPQPVHVHVVRSRGLTSLPCVKVANWGYRFSGSWTAEDLAELGITQSLQDLGCSLDLINDLVLNTHCSIDPFGRAVKNEGIVLRMLPGTFIHAARERCCLVVLTSENPQLQELQAASGKSSRGVLVIIGMKADD